LGNQLKYSGKLPIFIKHILGGIPQIRNLSSDESFWTRAAGWEDVIDFDVLNLKNSPNMGITTNVTLGFSNYELKDQKNNQPARRLELISILKDDIDFLKLTGDIEDKIDFYENLLMYVSCYMVFENCYLYPRIIWRRFFSNYYQQFSDMEHLFFVHPKLLTDKLQQPITIDDKQIEFLLCVPISDEELQYSEKNGPEALEQLLIKGKIDVSDLFRESVV
jgi:hypothetical protein